MDELSFKAIYGYFDIHMQPLAVNEVTALVAKKFLSEGKITIPINIDFNQCFGNPQPEERKFLQIQTENRTYNIIEDKYKQDVTIDLGLTEKRIKFVYYAYINRKSNWKEIVSNQLLQLKSYGILDEVDLYVHITDTENLFLDVIETVRQICREARISISNENYFEYPGLKLIYDLAKQDPESILLYMHTKGMSYNVQWRIPADVALLTGTFENWRRNMEAFNDVKVEKIGLFPSYEDTNLTPYFGIGEGWIRYNFWYARASYIIDHCEEPIVREFRYYWEIWLAGTKEKTAITHDCYNLYKEDTQKYFTVFEAEEELLHLSDLLNRA